MRVYNEFGQEIDPNSLFDENGRPLGVIPNLMAKAQTGVVGQAPAPPAPSSDIAARWPQFKGWTEILAQYVIRITLGGEDNATNGNSVNLRPEPFVCRRITFATDGDVGPYELTFNPLDGLMWASGQARVVEAQWSDEFTKFMGDKFCLLAAIFGDSDGFLDLPAPILLQGKQSPSITLRRLRWPFTVEEEKKPPTTIFDFMLHGVGLLPPGVQVSGSAG